MSLPVLAHHAQLARSGERWSREELLLRLSLLRGDVADLGGLREGELLEAADAVTYGLERAWARTAPLLAGKGERDLAAGLEREIERLHEAVHLGDPQKLLSARQALLPLLEQAERVVRGGVAGWLRTNLGLVLLHVLAVGYALAATVAAWVFYRGCRRRTEFEGGPR